MLNRRLCISLALLCVLIAPSLSFAQVGALEKEEITSPALGGKTKTFFVYLPPSYSTTQKEYPVIYMLHGFSQNAASLTSSRSTIDRMVQDGEIGEMIAVFPDGDNSWYVGEYEPYIVSELLDRVDAQYRTIPHRDSRGITGYSMGGYGAVHLSLKFPEVFSVAVSVAGAYWTHGVNIQEDLDPYLDQPVRLNGIKIVHGRGDSDVTVHDARAFDKKLTDLGIEHVYVEHGGGHSFWPEQPLQFFSDRLHPLHEIARLREGTTATTTPDVTVVGESTLLEVTVDVPTEANEAVRGIFLDLSPLGISSELPMDPSGGGRYTITRTITPSRSGRYPLPLIMETAFAWDIEGTRYPLGTVDVVVYLASDEYSLYQDEMAPEWEVNIPATAALDLAASDADAPEGSHAQAIELPSGYLKYIYQDPDGFSTFGYTTLQFWLNPGASSIETARFAVKTTEGTDYPKFREDLGITLAPNLWQLLSIPLEELGLAGTNTNLKELQFRGIEGTFYIDDLAFVVAEYGLEEAVASPERIKSDGTMSTRVTVLATPGVLEPGAPPTVTVNLSPIGGDPDAVMFDDGTGGDEIAGDGIYTIWTTASPETPRGLKDLVVSSTDRHLRVVSMHLPLAVLSTEDMYVYRDEIASGWSVGTRNILSDPSATAFVYDGEHSQEISVERSGTLVSYTWDDPEGFNAFGYTDLVFQILVTEPEQDPEARLTPVTGDAVSFRLGDQLGEPGIWQEIRIPLGGLAEADFRLKRFSFQGVDATLYIDDIRFIPETVSVSTEPTAVEVSAGSIVPSGYALSQNHPNPFNPETTIRYDLPEASTTRISLYNMSGQKLRTLVDGPQMPGRHSVTWDSRDDAGREVSSGVYLCRMEAGGYRAVRRLVLVR